METILQRHDLNYEVAFEYAKKHLIDGETLSNKLLGVLEDKRGCFFTLFPDSINFDRLDKIDQGWILPQNEIIESIDKNGRQRFSQRTPNINKEISSYLHSRIQDNVSEVCFFEDITEPGPNLEFFDKYGMNYLKEIYYWFNQMNCTADTIQAAIRSTNALWHQVFMIADVDAGTDIAKSISLDQLSYFAERVKLIILRAYDGEGFLFWEPVRQKGSIIPISGC